jgi:hypothetical protein
VDPKANPGGKAVESIEDQPCQVNSVEMNKGVEEDPFAWLGKHGEDNLGLIQDSGSSANKAAREDLRGEHLAKNLQGERLGDFFCTRCRTASHVARDCRRGSSSSHASGSLESCL